MDANELVDAMATHYHRKRVYAAAAQWCNQERLIAVLSMGLVRSMKPSYTYMQQIRKAKSVQIVNRWLMIAAGVTPIIKIWSCLIATLCYFLVKRLDTRPVSESAITNVR